MTVTKRKPKGLLLPLQESKPVHSHKKSDNDHIKSCRFFELGRRTFGNRCCHCHKKEFPPRSEDRPQSNNYLIIAKTVITGNRNLTLEINRMKALS